jgi:polyisoprenyl-phosphate glycosyltransferase
MKKISVLIACFNEEDNIIPMYSRLQKATKKIPYNFEYIYIDNASTDNSEQILNKLSKKDKKVKVIFMSRNFGSPQPSFLSGFQNIKSDAVILLQGDIQDPPEMIPEFIKKWQEGYSVVYGVRTKRAGYSFIRSFLYRAFYLVFRKLSYLDIPLEAGDFSILDKVVVNNLIAMNEYDYLIRGLRSYIGFRQIGIPYVREARTRGRSTESLRSNLWWAKTLIVNFSLKPLEFISKLAFLVMLLTFFLIFFNLGYYLIHRSAPPGIPTIVILILFLGGIQLLSLSIIAEYMAKMFLEIKARPKYIIRKKLNF